MGLNNKGWGLAELLIGIAIIIVFLLIAVFYSLRLNNMFNNKDNNNNTKDTKSIDESYYLNKISDMVIATDKYLKDNNLELEIDSSINIDLISLVQLNYIKEITDYKTNRTCNGYTLATKNNTGILDIKGYLKCDNYVSKGYDN